MTSLGNLPPQNGWRCGPKRGFTLIELLVVLAVLGFALTLIIGYRPPWSTGLSMRGTANELASGLRLARSEAISTNRPVVLELDLANHQYRVGGKVARSLPPALTMELSTLVSERRNATAGRIRFNPDGSSTGGRITMTDGKGTLAVGVDWLSGRVSIGDER